jgi:hypothetical protein
MINLLYKLIISKDTNGHAVYYRKGTSGIVIKAFNNELFFCVNEKVYALELIPSTTNKIPFQDTIP